jgi:hypothetical protein
MHWPLKPRPVPDAQTPIWSMYYLAASPAPSDPTMIWGTDVPMGPLTAYLREVNSESDVLISAAHVLVRAVGRCLVEHPEFRRRVVRRRLYEYKEVNVLVPVLGGPSGPEVCLLKNVDQRPLAEIARDLWQQSREIAKGTSSYQRDERIFRSIPRLLRGFLFRQMLWQTSLFDWPAALWGHRTCRSSTMINYLGHRGAPPMRSFKASRFPNEALPMNVTMGPTQPGPDGPAAPLFVRGDHRIVDGYQLGQFTGDLRRHLMEPAALERMKDE